jgi:hypothetical protein
MERNKDLSFGGALMKRRFSRISPLRILAVLMILIPPVLSLEFAIIKRGQRWQAEKHVIEGLSVIKQLGIAASLYASDHNERLPSADRWEQELRPYLPPSVSSYRFKPVLGREATRIVMNRELSGVKIDSLNAPANVILFFETAARTPGSSATLDALPTEEQMENSLLCWADSHCYARPTALRDYHIQESRKGMRPETAQR